MKTNYEVTQFGMEEIFCVYEDGKLIYDRDYGSLTKSLEEYIDDYRRWQYAPTIAMRDERVSAAVNESISCLSKIQSDLDGETMRYLVQSAGYGNLLSNWEDNVKYNDEINSLNHYIETLEHRLRMVKDDCNQLRNFINNNALEIFNKPSAQCSEAIAHILNIEIACDLDSNESLSWNYYSK